MDRFIANPGRYIQGPGALSRLGEYAGKYGKKLFVLLSKGNMTRIGEDIRAGLEASSMEYVFSLFGGECSQKEIDRQRAAFEESGCDAVAAVGGGKTLDTGKCMASPFGIPVIICPTAASSDAPCTSCAVIYNEDGSFAHSIHFPTNPDVILVDSAVAAAAPFRLTAAGIGDSLATYIEAQAAWKKNAPNVNKGGFSLTGKALARVCYESLLENGMKAKLAMEAGAVTPAVEDIIEANIYLSGMGFENNHCAFAHSINNGLSMIPGTHHLLHGEKVSFGLVCQLVLENASRELMDEVYTFLIAMGLPVTFSDLGLEDITAEELWTVGEAATRERETTRNMPFAVTPEMAIEAMKAADRYGWYYKEQLGAEE